jgi:transposase InsO family protein
MAQAGYTADRTISRHLCLQGEKLSPRSARRFRQDPLDLPKPVRRRRKPAKENPGVLDACAPFLDLPRNLFRPRLTCLLRTLADAFTEGIAADAQRRLDQGAPEAQDALLRSRRAEQLAILHARLGRIPPRARPRYTPDERAEILALKHRYRLSNRKLAAWFLLDPHTLSDWSLDVDTPERRNRPLVTPLPDLETAVRDLSEDLPPLPARLRQKVADTLHALAAKAPVRRRRARARRKAPARKTPAHARRPLSPIRAQRPNHYWSTDLTTIDVGRSFHLASIVDLYSRRSLAFELFPAQPTSAQIAALLDQATRTHGDPKHFLTDHGGSFLGETLTLALAQKEIDHRKGAVGQHGSIAIIERLWRTAKECLDLDTVRPRVAPVLRQRIAVVIDYYNGKRPHAALGNATPDQVYTGQISPAHHAQPAPRGWRGQPTESAPFVIRHAFPLERKLPYLERVA